MNMGDRIQRAWRSFVRTEINAATLRKEIDSLDWEDFGEDDTLYFYAVVGLHDGEPSVERFEGPMWPGYFTGAPSSKIVLAIPVHEGMTKQDLVDFDAAEESAYWELDDWADG